MGDDKTWKCEKCGGTVRIGDFPLCKGRPQDHGPWATQEAPMEALSDWNLSDDEDHPAEFTTRRELHKFLDENALQPHTNRDPLPKTARGTGNKLLFFDMGGSKR